MFKVIIILIFFSFYIPAKSSPKDKIISQMKLTNNLSFNFIQTINDKSEDGKCIIEYPKKIFCEYSNANKKKLLLLKFLVTRVIKPLSCPRGLLYLQCPSLPSYQ